MKKPQQSFQMLMQMSAACLTQGGRDLSGLWQNQVPSLSVLVPGASRFDFHRDELLASAFVLEFFPWYIGNIPGCGRRLPLDAFHSEEIKAKALGRGCNAARLSTPISSSSVQKKITVAPTKFYETYRSVWCLTVGFGICTQPKICDCREPTVEPWFASHLCLSAFAVNHWYNSQSSHFIVKITVNCFLE